MIDVCGKTITMDEGDYGLSFAFAFDGELDGITKIELIIKKNLCEDEPLILKDVSPNEYGICIWEFTKEESNKLSAGRYYWGLKFYEGENVLNTVESSNPLIVGRCV